MKVDLTVGMKVRLKQMAAGKVGLKQKAEGFGLELERVYQMPTDSD